MIAKASSRLSPRPKKAGAEPMPPKLPQPSTTSISGIIATGSNSRRSNQMPFQLPDLPYAHDALEPHIDARTMEIHHGKHHQAYVDNANKALDGTEWADRSVEDIL